MSNDEERLGRAIATVYDRLPEPDTSKLTAIEARLVRALPKKREPRRARGWYWWLIAALATSAAAAWWVEEFFTAESSKQGSVQHAPTLESTGSDNASPGITQQYKEKSPKGNSTSRPTDSTTIYRRETY